MFLDRDLVIRTFTPAVAQYVPVQESDRGRPLTDFAVRPAYPNLAADLKNVLATEQEIERRIEPATEGDARSHLVRIVPYRTRNNAIAGVIVTFIAIMSATPAQQG